jgi:hypothetical protein
MMAKINDAFEFYDHLNLDKYMAYDSFDNDYTLHSVVVHQGSVNSGHYYAFIKPTLEDNWILFNDETVRPADKYEVFESNFGGNFNTYKARPRGEIVKTIKSYDSNAYVLVYIRNSKREQILCPVTDEDINPTVRERFEQDIVIEKKQQQKKIRLTENFNICLLTNETILGYNGLGITNSLADLNADAPLFMNKARRLIINFPKCYTLGNFVEFISQETGIPMGQLLLYEYDAIFLENLIRRNDFELIPIPKQYLSKTFSEYTNNFKKNFLFLYINALDDYRILKPGTGVEEYYQGNKLDKLIHVSKDLNSFSFNKDNMIIDNGISYSGDLKILFLKVYNRESNMFEVRNIQCISFEYYRINFGTFLEFLQTLFGYKCENFYVESSCLLLDKDSEETISPILLTHYNITSLFNKSNSMILIPENLDDIDYKIETLTTDIYVDMHLYSKQLFLLNKLKLNFKYYNDESFIKKCILEKVIEGNLFHKIFNTELNYYLDIERNLQPLSTFINDRRNFTIDHVDLLPDRDSNQRYNSIYKDYPVFKYLNFNEMRIDFNINLYPKQVSPDINFEEISVYDKDNNKLYTLSSIFTRRCKKAKECIDYIYDVAIADNTINPDIWDRGNYYFILQHPKVPYIYQLLIDNNCELFSYEGKADIQYRLQPFSDEEVEYFGNNNYLKMFVFFQANGGSVYIDPLVMYIDRNERFRELKTMVLDKIMKIRKVLELFDIGSDSMYDPENLTAIISSCLSFYQVKIHDCKIKKEVNLHGRDNESVDNIFKDVRVYNLLVEINKI